MNKFFVAVTKWQIRVIQKNKKCISQRNQRNSMKFMRVIGASASTFNAERENFNQEKRKRYKNE